MRFIKNNNNTSYLIKKCVETLKGESFLNDFELKFLELDYDINKLSLTGKQDINHQLRFFHNEYAFLTINSVAIKLSENNRIFEDIEIIGTKLSDYELFFLERISQLSSYSFIIKSRNIKGMEEVKVSFENFRHFQEIGNNYTAKIIGEKLFSSGELNQDSNFLKLLSFVYSETGNPLAAEPLLKKVISAVDEDEVTNNARTSAMYRLAMLLLREYPAELQDKNKATNLLNEAYQKIINPNYKFPEEIRVFSKVFNRNGFALVLFQNNKYDEAIQLIKSLILELEELANKNIFAKLHSAVLNYNLYQLYHAKGEVKNAENAIKYVIKLDSNDIDYKYDYILFLFENQQLDEARNILTEMYCEGVYDLVFHNTYFGYYYIQKYDFVTAEEYCRKAYKYFCFEGYQKRNQFLYNYLFCLKNNCKYDEMNYFKKDILLEEPLAKEIQELYL